MTALKHRVIGAGFNVFAATGLHRRVAPRTRGLGAILTLHRVRLAQPSPFAPNALLEVTPEFLDRALAAATALGYRFVALDAVPALLAAPKPKPFVALTFDDGYRDTLSDALPVLERHAAPFTVFATTGFVDRTARLWWVELERVIHRLTRIDVTIEGRRLTLATDTPARKQAAFARLQRALLALDDAALLAITGELCAQAGIAPLGLTAELCMDERELRCLLASPLATLGCHTMTHPRLALASPSDLSAEMAASRRDLETRFDRPVRHFCYPYGMRAAAGEREFAEAKTLGYQTAVTTRPGVLRPEHANHLTALPRISLNGLWQTTDAFEILLSGAPFALWNAAAPRVTAAAAGPAAGRGAPSI